MEIDPCGICKCEHEAKMHFWLGYQGGYTECAVRGCPCEKYKRVHIGKQICPTCKTVVDKEKIKKD